jgi:zinc protease
VRAWYRRFYTPTNATLVVVGDVNPKEVFALAEQHFGKLPAEPVHPTTIAAEPRQDAERRTRLSVPAEVPSFYLGYHVPVLQPGARSWEPYALSVLNGILDGGNSARFETALVREQKIASHITVAYDLIARGGGLFTISGTPAKGHSVEELEKAVLAEIERVQKERVSDAELRRVKAQVVARDVYQRDSVFYQAMQIGMFATTGLDWRLIEEGVKRINAVTAEQVQEVANKYLLASNRTVAILDPLPIDGKKPRAAPGGGGHGR